VGHRDPDATSSVAIAAVTFYAQAERFANRSHQHL